MTQKEIKELLVLVSDLDIKEVEIRHEQFKLRIRTGKDNVPTIIGAPGVATFSPSQAPPSAAPAVAPKTEPTANTSDAPKTADNLITIKSPMVGTFYRSASPEKPAYVNVGDVVSKGTVLCIIEAMKLFNEIESEVSGKIVKVLADDSTPIEYDQPLFLVDPQG